MEFCCEVSMPTKSRYNTNLASEFYALSMLYRRGFDANLTLGNKKSVDIVVTLSNGRLVTIDVKGLAGKTGWPVDNLKKGSRGHYYVFISFLDDIENPSLLPEVYIVPSVHLRHIRYNAPSGRKLVRLATLRKKGSEYKDAWGLLRSGK